MQLMHKIKEVCLSLLPVLLLVGGVQAIWRLLPTPLFIQFLIALLFLVLGMALFLQGVETGLQWFGRALGSHLAKKGKLPYFLSLGFLVGFLVTVAEPDLQVLAGQVQQYVPGLSPVLLILMVGLGSGLFVLIGLLRTSFQWGIKTCLVGAYVLVAVLAWFAHPSLRALAFDSGGVTTGPLTVPFLLAMGLGIAGIQSSRAGEEEGFGMVGLMSVGPLVAVLGFSTGVQKLGTSVATQQATEVAQSSWFAQILGQLRTAAGETALAFSPLLILFLLLQFRAFHLPRQRFFQVVSGFVFSAVGLILFLAGTQFGVLPTAKILGGQLAALDPYWLLALGALFGIAIVLAEPAVWILTHQIYRVTSGNLQRWQILLPLAGGVGMAIFLAMARLVWNIPYLWILIPGYVCALLLLRTSTPLMAAIAFDSGGVASGVLASTFLMPFTLGAAQTFGRSELTEAFGVISLVAMAPLLVIQFMGVLAARKPDPELLLWNLLQEETVRNREREWEQFHFGRTGGQPHG